VSAGSGWRIFVDTGGTFTDALAVNTSGEVRRAKILSSGALRGTIDRADGRSRLRVRADWSLPDDFLCGFRFRVLEPRSPEVMVSHYDAGTSTIELSEAWPTDLVPGQPFEAISPEESPVLAARILTRTPPGRPLPVESLRLATTLGTNALLERRGVRTALFVTRGFADLILIGTQQRPDLFALDVRRPAPLYESVVEVDERIAADGSVLRPLEEREIVDSASHLAASGIESAAVALLHSHRNPRHEERVQEILECCGIRHVSRSSLLAPFIRILPRAETAVVDAYLAPVVRSYLDRVGASLVGGRLHVMTSAGGVVTMTAARPKDMLLSGPAGGVVGAAIAGRKSGFTKIIAFDMGGTSTDVARFDGDYEYTFEHQVGDAHLVAPALAIESVAAGGGSICAFEARRLRVGPRSAGASPGPACYGAGGPLTLTDVNLLLGRLDPARFGIPIGEQAAQRAADLLVRALAEESAPSPAREAVLSGLVDIADERMADAIRTVSVRRGYDPADYALVAFGGAGGLHACDLAAALQIPRVLIPRLPGGLSALGILRANVVHDYSRTVQRNVESVAVTRRELSSEFAKLESRGRAALKAENFTAERIRSERLLDMRYVGQAYELTVPEAGDFLKAFHTTHERRCGYADNKRVAEVVNVRARLIGVTDQPKLDRPRVTKKTGSPANVETRRALFAGRAFQTRVYDRAALNPGQILTGPAIVSEYSATTVVPPGWRCNVDSWGNLVLTQARR